MIRRTHAQTECRAREETGKCKDVCPRRRCIPRLGDRVQETSCNAENNGANEMRIDVHGFIVQVGEAPKTLCERTGCGSVSRVDVVIVLLP